MPDLENKFITVCTTAETDSKDQLDEAMTNAVDIQPPELVPNRESYYMPGEYEEFELLYSESDPETPRYPATYRAIVTNIIEDDEFHVHSYFDEEAMETILDFHSSLLTPFDEVHFRSFSSVYKASASVIELIDTSVDDELDLNGIDIAGDRWRFQISNEDDGSIALVSLLDHYDIDISDLKYEVAELLSEAGDVSGDKLT
jgi:hypothetical protein